MMYIWWRTMSGKSHSARQDTLLIVPQDEIISWFDVAKGLNESLTFSDEVKFPFFLVCTSLNQGKTMSLLELF